MTNKRYRVAVMGASGSGKTVFLGSYFNLVTNLGQGRHVSLKTVEAAGEVKRIIGTLFKQQVPVQEKARKDIISFSVDSLDMDIRFIEIPEGKAENKRDWKDPGFLQELKLSEGVLFFVSAEDLMENPEKLLRESETFREALSFLLDTKSSRWSGGEGAPVIFLFTKGDSVPHVTVEQLKEKMKELFCTDDSKTLSLSVFFSGSSEKINAFKVTSIGRWAESKKLPKEYEPQNVIKPMEELYKMMSSLDRERKKTRSAVIAVVALLALSSAVTWGMDQYRWNTVKSEARKLASASQFEDALKTVDSLGEGYIFPDPIPLIPSALRGGADKEALRSGILKAYEQAQFNSLQPLIEKIDTSRMPDVKSAEYLDASEKVEEYLANLDFRKINQANFDKIQSLWWYFEAGQALHGKTVPGAEGAVNDSGEAFNLVESWLGFLPKLPAQWKNEGVQKTGELFAFWADMLSPDAGIEAVEAFVASAKKLSGNPNATEELKKLITERETAWKQMIAAKWADRGAKWVREASALSPEKGIEKILSSLKREDLPESIGNTLSSALEGQYIRLAETLAGDAAAGIETLKGVVARYPEMPEGARKTLSDRILALAKNEASKISAGIEAAGTLEALGARLPDLELPWTDYPAGKDDVAASFKKTFSRLVASEWEKIAEKGSALAEKKDFSGAKELFVNSVEALAARLEKAGLGAFGNGAVAEAAEVRNKKIDELRQSHLSACKAAFEGLKSSKNKEDIPPVAEMLKAFAVLWPDSEEAEAAEKTVLFLDAVQNGANAVLTIVNGDFSAVDSLLDSPDMKILMKKDGKTVLETKTVDNEVRPAFGEKVEFTWDFGSRFTFVGMETGGILGSDKEVFNVSVDAGGISGYKKLNGTLKNNGNSITIKLETGLPESPWN